MRLFVLAAVALALAATSFPASAQSTIVRTFDAQSNSGQTGLLSITPDASGNGIVVNVSVVGEPAGATEPMHIHTGQCGPTLGGVYKPLQNLVDGHSVTTVQGVTVYDLMRGTYAINIHKGPGPNISTYVACTNIHKG